MENYAGFVYNFVANYQAGFSMNFHTDIFACWRYGKSLKVSTDDILWEESFPKEHYFHHSKDEQMYARSSRAR